MASSSLKNFECGNGNDRDGAWSQDTVLLEEKVSYLRNVLNHVECANPFD